MVLKNNFIRSLATAASVAAGLITVGAEEALAADSTMITDRGLISADDVAINQTLSFAVVKVSNDYEDTASYTVYHDGKSQVLGVTIHNDGYVSVNGRSMNGYDEREMYETLRDGLVRTQPDPANYRVPAVAYAHNNGLPLGGAVTTSGQYMTGFDRSEGSVGSCAIVDPQRILCLTNIYNERASEYSARIDVYQVNDMGRKATQHSAEYSRAYNSDKERDRYEQFVAKGQQGLQNYP